MSVMVGCGVVGHGNDCLCDVHIERPVGIINNLADGWLIKELADIYGMSAPWKSTDMLFLFSKSAELHDIFVEQNKYRPDQDVHIRGSQESFPQYWTRIKRTIETILASETQIPDVELLLQALKLDVPQFMQAITFNHCDVNEWDLPRLKNLVSDIQSQSRKSVCRQYGLNSDGSGKWMCKVFKKNQP